MRSTGGVSVDNDVRMASVLRGMRGGVCICLARGGVGGSVVNPV